MEEFRLILGHLWVQTEDKKKSRKRRRRQKKERECEFDKAITSTPLLKYFLKETRKPAFLDWKDLFLLLRSDILYRLENQIPFFILEALYSQLSDGSTPKKEDGTKVSLTDLALFYIHMGDEKSPPLERIPNHHVYHLLNLFHASSCNQPSNAEKHKEKKTPGGEESEKPERETKSQAGENSEKQEGDMAEDEENMEVTEDLFFIFLFLLLLPIILVFFLLGLYHRKKTAAWLSDEEKSVASRMIPCATDVRNAGIKFEKRNADNLLDVKFDMKRTLEIPVFSIREETAYRLMQRVYIYRALLII